MDQLSKLTASEPMQPRLRTMLRPQQHWQRQLNQRRRKRLHQELA
jgi:hypothetical protein